MKNILLFLSALPIIFFTSCKDTVTDIDPDQPIAVSQIEAGNDPSTYLLIGQKVEIKGVGLHGVAKVTIDGVEAAILTRTAGTISFNVPMLDVEAGSPIKCELLFYGYAADYTAPAATAAWSGALYVMIPPTFDDWTQTGALESGDEVTFTGRYLDKIKSMEVGGQKAEITTQSATSITIKIPENIGSKNSVYAYFGPASEYRITATTSLQVALPGVPVLITMTPEDGVWGAADIRYYLSKKVTIEGLALHKVSTVTVGGFAASIVSKSSTQLVFTMPDGFVFNTATVVPVDIDYPAGNADNGEAYAAGKLGGSAKVYPFYYWKNVTVGQDPDRRFFSLDDGRVVSANEWYESNWDPIARSSVNTGSSFQAATSATPTSHTAANVPNPAFIPNRETYLSVKPYLISNNRGLYVPANSCATMRDVKYFTDRDAGTTVSILDGYSNTGTPMFKFRSQNVNSDLPANIKDLSFENIMITSGGNPSSANGAAAGMWVAGDVVVVKMLPYNGDGSGTGLSLSYKIGVIKVVENNTTDNTLTFDFFWPKNFRYQ